jgi:hypothetical protein
MPDTMLAPESTLRRQWDGLGEHGFVYLDSFGDTGVTLVPRVSKLMGSTGTWGDPRWETLDLDNTYCIFFADPLVTRLVPTFGSETAWWPDVVTITPPREKVRRPEPVQGAVPHVALETVLAGMRGKAGFAVGDLAAMLGISRRQYYNWMDRTNEPDLEQDQRVRRTATLVARLHLHYGQARMVRAALLTPTAHGSAFDALRAGNLTGAERATEEAMAAGPSQIIATSQNLPFDRERVLTELEHLRHAPLQGDG